MIDASGKAVLPGLIDMNGHMYVATAKGIANAFESYRALYLAGGGRGCSLNLRGPHAEASPVCSPRCSAPTRHECRRPGGRPPRTLYSPVMISTGQAVLELNRAGTP